jgi:hypothetical protein
MFGMRHITTESNISAQLSNQLHKLQSYTFSILIPADKWQRVFSGIQA